MRPQGFRIAAAVPQTLQTRLEIMVAIRTLEAPDGKRVQQRQTEIAALRRDIELLRGSLPELVRECIDEARREYGSLLRPYLRKFNSVRSHAAAGVHYSRAPEESRTTAVLKASADDTEHPGWPAGTPGREGRSVSA